MLSPRYAVAYTPPPASPLARFGAGVLGYDCFEAADMPQRAVPGIDPAILSLLTVGPRRHGFSARLVPSFRLGKASEDDLAAAIQSLADRHYPMPIGRLVFDHRDEFIVLRAEHRHPQFDTFMRACRDAFSSMQAANPAADAEDGETLSNLSSGFDFHIALAGPVPEGGAGDLTRHLARVFERLARDEVEIGSISLMRQDDQAARFRVLTCMRQTGR
jgi:hypothetical protein